MQPALLNSSDAVAAAAAAHHAGAFHLLFARLPAPMLVYDRETLAILEVNEAASAQYGYSREAFLAMTLEDLVHPEHLPLRAGVSPPGRLGIRRHRHADGRVLEVEITRSEIEFGGRSAVCATAIDVTERRIAERRLEADAATLRREHAHLAHAQRVAGMGSVERDLLSDCAVWSDETYRIFGVPRDFELSTENLLKLVHPEDHVTIHATRALMRRGIEPDPFEYRIIRPDGSMRVIYRENHVEFASDGTPLRLVGTVHDITELRRSEERQRELEQQLLHSQKLEALGTLAGGIAHDLNNTLVPILALSKTTARTLPADSRARRNLETIAEAAERARDLVRQILAFSRKEALKRQRIDMAEVVREALALLRPSLPASIALVERVAEVPATFGDAAQLRQVVINIATNAAQAIGNANGEISVTLAPAEGALRLAIADTGCGIAPALLSRIFEPYFTTREVGAGSGLGLAVVHGIVTGHGGTITVASEPGRGTTFEIMLPTAESD